MYAIKTAFTDNHGNEIGAFLSHYDIDCELLIFVRNAQSEQSKKQAMKFESIELANNYIKDNSITDNTEIDIIEID